MDWTHDHTFNLFMREDMSFGPRTTGIGLSSLGDEQHEQKLGYYKQFWKLSTWHAKRTWINIKYNFK